MKVYVAEDRFHCGPCSFINMIGLKGDRKLESKLSEIGRLKPFYVSLYSSFLIWSRKYKVDLLIFTASKKLNNKMFRLMFLYEKIPKNLQNKYKKLAKSRLEKINRMFDSKIRVLRNPIKKLDKFLNENYKVAILISILNINPVPHWVVAFKKEKDKYYFMDSAKGITALSKKDLLERFEINKKLGFYPQLIAYKG